MICVIIEHNEPTVAAKQARQLYRILAEAGRHVIIDTPWEFRTNLPERRLSAADVLVKAHQATTSSTQRGLAA